MEIFNFEVGTNEKETYGKWQSGKCRNQSTYNQSTYIHILYDRLNDNKMQLKYTFTLLFLIASGEH